MITLSRILVDIDPIAPAHPALDHAVALAARSGAALKIVDVLPLVPAGIRHYVTNAIEEELVEHRRAALSAIAATISGVTVSTELLRGRPAHALIDEVRRGRHDLIVRSHARDLAPGARPFGAIDMELLRHCPSPVWLVGRRHRADAPWRILAAVHAEGDAESAALNHAILDWALSLRALTDAHLTVLQAWAPFGASVLQTRMSARDFATFADSGRAHEQAVLHDLLAPYRERLAGAPVELVEGEPDHAIADYVDIHGVDIVVMGTVARSGIAGAVMGNTAERVLRRLRGSVLAIKPGAFPGAPGR